MCVSVTQIIDVGRMLMVISGLAHPARWIGARARRKRALQSNGLDVPEYQTR